VSQCRSCEATVEWTTTKNGKLMPVDPDGTSHFASCQQAAEWRKSPQLIRPCPEHTEAGIALGSGTETHAAKASCPSCGRFLTWVRKAHVEHAAS
jgi:hypothetical protein